MSFTHLKTIELNIETFFEQLTALVIQIHQATDVLGILNITVQQAREILGSDRVIIYQFLGLDDGVIAAESVETPWTPIIGQLIYDPCFANKWKELYRQGRISRLEDIYSQPLQPCYLELLERLQVRANLVVPIIINHTAGAQLWGLVIAHQCDAPRQWQPLEIKFLQYIAVQLGIALEKIEQKNSKQEIINSQRLLKAANDQSLQELHWKQALLRSMTDTSTLAFYVVDNRTDSILYFNHRFCEIWGIEHLETQMQLGHLKNNDIIPDCMPLIANLPAFIESCKPLQSEENRCTHEDEISFTDGRTIRRFSSQIRDSEDRYFGRLYIFEDISERKRIEEALRESEERYRSVIAVMAEGIVLHQADGQIIACNHSATRILGLSYEQMMGRTSVDPRWHAIHEDGSPFRGENHPAMVTLRTGQPQSNIVMGVYKPEGSLTWISINSQPLFYPNSEQPYGVVASFTDITERKQLELHLQQSEAKFRAIYEQANAGIVLVDSSGKLLSVNERFCELIGYPQTELKQMNFLDLTYPDDHGLSLDYHQKIWSGQISNYCTDKRYVRKNGQIFWANLTVSAIYNPLGQLQYGVGVVVDITERKRVEQLLQQQTVRERMIHEIAHKIRQSLDLTEILNTTVAQVREFLQTDRVIIYRLNPDCSGIVVTESVAPGWLAIVNREITDSYFVETEAGNYHGGKINNVPDIYTAGFSPCHLELLERLQVRAKLVVPIVQKERTWGLLIAHHCSSPRQWEPFEAELLTQLSTQVAIAIGQSELYQQLQAQILVDELTQIANRRCFERDFNHEWYRLTREKRFLSLLLCDIDYFKQYNDTYGHPAGDICLKQVAQALKQAARRMTDLVARYGGEEFVILLPNTDSYGATQVAVAVQQAIDHLHIPHLASAVASSVTISIGIASMIPTADTCPLDLINAADQALYQAKAQGRDRYWVYG
ncbi:PAS domain S-box protein [Gloeothece verrucosa]|uniref:Diguanylate cyclase with PAS/PAC and GAF sensors n=1 Tax=Gloeothece verrucosa (strain PCC 7822) TaxID=497965 RepID=E0U979_GLOV7|nr:PAS domain S-box protein [Gloeothece verrucosa]ADN17337.1 diguanylate cyclase with PAS/PAC and GAF sensors [Gloeothece verrucosa PCC 7822]